MKLSKTTFSVSSILLLASSFLLGRYGLPASGPGVAPADLGSMGHADQHEEGIWTCSMHPQVRLPNPGKCPICTMDLIPANSGDDAGDDTGPGVLKMSAGAMALADIQTAKVERKSVAHEVRMVGKVALDETRLAYITSRVSGRLDRLFVDYTGVPVRAGDHLVEIYSPTLYSAQQELLQAISTAKELEGSNLEIVRATTNQTVISARAKLRLYGLNEEQIEKVIAQGIPDEHITIRTPSGGVVIHKNALEGMYVTEGTQLYTIADLSKVWVLLDAYESDLEWLRYGQDVEFRVEAYPGEIFHARVAFIDPLLNDHTRTVKVRLNVDNAKGRLKPEMFVSANVQAVLTDQGNVVDADMADKWICPMHPEVRSSEFGECPECGMDLLTAADLGFVAPTKASESLVIPSTAPLITGRRAVVYVRLDDREEPTFEGREIELGPRAGDWYVVRSGLEEGDSVVVKGNFKIDSELQIRARPSMMNPRSMQPRASGQPDDKHMPEHQSETPVELEGNAIPDAFRAQLGAVMDSYIALQLSLAADSEGLHTAQKMLESLGGVDLDLLEGEAHIAWMEQFIRLKASADAVVQADGIDQRRDLLSPLSEHMIRALKTFGYQRDGGQVGIFNCPMAVDGEPANWIQEGEETLNPYMGSAMLGCGSFTETIALEN